MGRVLAPFQLAATLQACHEGGDGLSPDAGRRADVGRVGELLLQAAPERPGVRRLPQGERVAGCDSLGSGRWSASPAGQAELARAGPGSVEEFHAGRRAGFGRPCDGRCTATCPVRVRLSRRLNPEPSACSTSRADASMRGRAASRRPPRSVAVSRGVEQRVRPADQGGFGTHRVRIVPGDRRRRGRGRGMVEEHGSPAGRARRRARRDVGTASPARHGRPRTGPCRMPAATTVEPANTDGTAGSRVVPRYYPHGADQPPGTTDRGDSALSVAGAAFGSDGRPEPDRERHE